MRWVYDDGGRAEAGFRGLAGDCGARAVAIAAGIPYREAYDRLNAAAKMERRKRKSNARTGVWPDTMSAVLMPLGFVWTPTMHVGSGCRVHLADGELPSGRLVVRLSKHYTAVIDGVIHDTFNPDDRPAIFYPPGARDIPSSAQRNDAGVMVYAPKRCVYGYWRK
jgi:hypothetical protein